ncbi:hypothetical protein ZWY2020_004999 [Hordeum vulgare]|nr:hypothetical protein ZWY2020_004999 [Hordeum vulgare]
MDNTHFASFRCHYLMLKTRFSIGAAHGFLGTLPSSMGSSSTLSWTFVLCEVKVDAGTAQPTLKAVHIGQLTLSVQDDDIVYLLSKVDHQDEDRNRWVLAVDAKSKTIRGVSEFGVQRTLGLSSIYIASRISEYLKFTRGIILCYLGVLAS